MRLTSWRHREQRLLRLRITGPSATQVADDARGAYLCEVCEDVMTDDVLPAAESPHGREIAICAPCWVTLTSGQ